MTTPQIDDDQIQRYFDGELSPAEAEALRQAIEASEEHQAKLEQLERLRSLVRMAAEEMTADLPADDLYARVKGELEAKGRRDNLRSIEGGASRRRAVTGAAVGLALAAAVVLALLRPGTTDDAPVARPETETPETAVASRQGEPEAPTRGEQGSRVEEVDFGGNTGTVFEVEGSAGHDIAVVWIDDQEQLQ
ncbi:MAG: anti-sigma factor family protein [Myxococcota bacterium]